MVPQAESSEQGAMRRITNPALQIGHTHEHYGSSPGEIRDTDVDPSNITGDSRSY